MSDVTTTGMSYCTACGNFYRYRGSLHCPTDAPVTITPKSDDMKPLTC